MNIKILLAEDHELTRHGIAYGLKKYENIEIVAEAENGQEAVELVKKFKPDLILMDIIMPVLNGINATKEIKAINPDIKIIMLTSNNEKEKVISAFNSGANAYCMKTIRLDDLVIIIKTVMDGALWMDPSIAGYILEILQSRSIMLETQKENCVNFNLTNREKEILTLISDGLNNRDISDKLFLSLYTVKNHVSNIFQKLAVDDRTQAAIIALKENII
ncbi:MAG: response regulator transcription factor [Candidatus Gastranaerophilales bacterium]|nr:response regulator transcription factor [Candidatus Gastranaerophilales bacterium]